VALHFIGRRRRRRRRRQWNGILKVKGHGQKVNILVLKKDLVTGKLRVHFFFPTEHCFVGLAPRLSTDTSQ
jgi:hypothetical protein